MRHLTRRDVLVVLLALSVAPAVYLGRIWKANADRGGQEPAEPFRIAGNFHYVGANDLAAFLITGPEGHIVLDGGKDPVSAPMIIASIAKLGFNIKDVKVLLNSAPGPDHAGGLAALQQASGADLWASEGSADVIASGGNDPNFALPLRIFVQIGFGYPPARVDHRFRDGDTIRVGPIALTAHVTGGSTPGCTSWSFPVRDSDRVLNVVSACPLEVVMGMRYPEQRADLERSFRVLRNLPADIWVTSRARPWGRYRKFVASQTAKNPVDPFIDPRGYGAFIDEAEEEFRQGVVH